MTNLRRRLLFAAAGLAVAAILVTLYRPGYGNLREMEAALAAAELEHQRLEAEHAQLSRQVQQLQDDPLELEREARQQLRLVRPGEVIYKFPTPEDP